MRTEMYLYVRLVQKPSITNAASMHWLLLPQQATQLCRGRRLKGQASTVHAAVVLFRLRSTSFALADRRDRRGVRVRVAH